LPQSDLSTGATASTPVLAPPPLVSSNKRIPELDGVRGLAIAFVLIFHCLEVSLPGHKFLYYALLPTHQMWSGVDLFFVLSGFLIGGILLDRRESPSYYSTFYARRIHRIFPIYYLMVIGLFIGIRLFPQSPLFHGSIPLWTYPLFAQNLTNNSFTDAAPWLGVSWSLAVEEQFYLLLPLAVRLFSKRTLRWFVVICIFGAPLLRAFLIMLGVTHDQMHARLPCRADALALGVAAAMIVRSESATAWVRRHAKVLYPCMLFLYVSLLGLLKWSSFNYLNAVAFTFFDVMYFLLILLLLLAPVAPLKLFFNLAVLRWLGTISYCAYLIHTPIQLALFYVLGLGGNTTITGRTTLLANLAALAITLVVAQISWMTIEKRLIQRAHVRYRYAGAQT
jgi:peptidoglycan/LPS O-acetylase OafA/YrhL